jgi:transcription initiation factor TFIID subunit 2
MAARRKREVPSRYPEADPIPFSYFDEIQRPMDLGTMQAKLSRSEYSTMEKFKSDMQLIFSNCRQFNPPLTYPVNCAKVLEDVFNKEWTRAVQKKLESKDKRAMLGIINKFLQDQTFVTFRNCFYSSADAIAPSWWVFWDPVDPVALGIPTYFDIIPRKNARDLKTIRSKLEGDKYDSPEALEADIGLMAQNAITFNGADSQVGQIATRMRAKVQDELARVTGGGVRKRKEAGGATPQPGAKKVRLG